MCLTIIPGNVFSSADNASNTLGGVLGLKPWKDKTGFKFKYIDNYLKNISVGMSYASVSLAWHGKVMTFMSVK